ncbi:hypothetical protein NP493_1g04024 [Ridgeia piscesae]|uniref:Uncharacterized protein n=1 Tax=Ridgeia piscesae TaxID=27915 RepID=A0AAD9PGR6_RIDPI|nr:hypothetical protein NP493_1g04024 [Ridgeia piscesae]
MKLILVNVTAAVLLTTFVVTSAQSPAPPTQTLLQKKAMANKCSGICHSIKVACVEKICEPSKAQDRNMRWWCLGGCVYQEKQCYIFCLRANVHQKLNE